MFIETIRSEGLGHLSYIIGDGGEAAVIDPRRDCKIYKEIADKHGVRISSIFETHRHEDFIVGSLELSRRTDARIYHGTALNFKYGEPTKEEDSFTLGNLRLSVLETPGHTPESISLALYDLTFSENIAIGVFTGDALFVGDVGRTDFDKEHEHEMARALYSSIHNKLLPLGDQAILYPAHGKGSVCGANLAAREFSTLGYERQFNPLLQLNRTDFVEHKVKEEHYVAPYFKQMERLNQDGIPLRAKLPEPKPVDAETFAEFYDRDQIIVLDVRSAEAFAGAHIPGSLSIPLEILASFAGWFLPHEKEIGLVTEREEDLEKARIALMRVGYDNVSMYLKGGMHSWERQGLSFESIQTVHVAELADRIQQRANFVILDVRSHAEFVENPSDYSEHFYVGELPQHLKALPRDRKITTFCASGNRAIIAASLLKQSPWFKDVEVCLGSRAAWDVLEEKALDDLSRIA